MRTWTGCITCRSRKVKCDETRPWCNNCKKARIHCVPCEPVSFRHWRNPSVDDGYGDRDSGPFKQDHVWVKIDSDYKFIDETDIIAAEYQNFVRDEDIEADQDDGPSRPFHGPSQTDRQGIECSHSRSILEDRTGSDTTVPWQASLPAPQTPSQSSATDQSAPYVDVRGSPLSHQDAFHVRSDSHSVGLDLREVADIRVQLHSHGSRRAVADARNSWHTTAYSSGGPLAGPGSIANAGAQALLSMRHQYSERYFTSYAASNVSDPLLPLSPQTWNSNDVLLPSLRRSSTREKLQPPGPLTSPEEANLLRRFSSEVGRWMDLSDLSQTFSKKVCQLALHDPLLKAASIACAAKQLYLTGKLQDGMETARRNYDTAISLLIRRLGKSEQPFASYGFAATVICSCYEMLDATGSDWQRHLEGVFSFGRVHSVNGSCGGIEQAGFWSIARQEVVCSIINRLPLRLDPELWAVDLENIGQEGSEDLVNNQILTILAKVVNFMAKSEAMSHAGKEAMVEEWQKLSALLDHWKRSVQGFMDPVAIFEMNGKVFRTIWFARSMCASSWQMFHLAQILLLTINPDQDSSCVLAFRAIEGDLLHHARQICGIAQSKPHGSCRVNSVQPIYYAGCCFSNTDERKAAVKLLEDIEDELGWAAKYRVRDLHEQWGWPYRAPNS